MAQHWVADEYGDVDVLRFVETPVRAPGPGEVTITVRAAGVNPVDGKRLAGGVPLPYLPGFEVSGTVTAVGPGSRIATGEVAVGDEVIAFRISGGYATHVTVAGEDVFAKPSNLTHPEAANLLLVGVTGAHLVHLAAVERGDTVLIHGASGSVGISASQQALRRGARVIGTASPGNFEKLRRFGVEPVAYGEGLIGRVRALAPGGVTAALDTVGGEEALRTSLELVGDPARVSSVAAGPPAIEAGVAVTGSSLPAAQAFRQPARVRIVELAAAGGLVVPVARTFPLADARDALRLVASGHPGGKVALVP